MSEANAPAEAPAESPAESPADASTEADMTALLEEEISRLEDRCKELEAERDDLKQACKRLADELARRPEPKARRTGDQIAVAAIRIKHKLGFIEIGEPLPADLDPNREGFELGTHYKLI